MQPKVVVNSMPQIKQSAFLSYVKARVTFLFTKIINKIINVARVNIKPIVNINRIDSKEYKALIELEKKHHRKCPAEK